MKIGLTPFYKKRIFILGFSVDNIVLACHLGCKNFFTTVEKEMVSHLLGEHNTEELKEWRISVEMLKLI